MIWRSGVVVSRRTSWAGAREFEVEVTDGAAPLAAGTRVRALAYPDLVGDPGDAVGQRVLLTASALARGLGTGGYAMVVAFPDAPASPIRNLPRPHRQGPAPLQYLTLRGRRAGVRASLRDGRRG